MMTKPEPQPASSGGYTLFSLDDDNNKHTRSGLTLEHAFEGLLENADCGYRFEREAGTMWLAIDTRRDWPMPAADDEAYESSNPDDAVARREIMLAVIKNMWGIWCVMPDEVFASEQAGSIARAS